MNNPTQKVLSNTYSNTSKASIDNDNPLSISYSISTICKYHQTGKLSDSQAVELCISRLLALARACGLRLELQRQALQSALDEVEDDLLRLPNRRQSRYSGL